MPLKFFALPLGIALLLSSCALFRLDNQRAELYQQQLELVKPPVISESSKTKTVSTQQP
jgi:hypothetical protein